jgi:hypothetical protein
MTKFRCVSDYHNTPANLHFNAGQVIEVEDTLASFLRNDSPGSFEPVTTPAAVETADMPAPPRTTSLKRATHRKGAGVSDDTDD